MEDLVFVVNTIDFAYKKTNNKDYLCGLRYAKSSLDL